MHASPAFAITLFRRDDLRDEGLYARSVTRAIESGEYVRVRPGVFVRGDDARDLTVEERFIVRGRALDLVSRSAPVLSHYSAAAAHGLPLWRISDRRAHVIASDARPGAAVGVVRHRGDLGPDDIVEIDGLLCTSLSRTVADLARTAAFSTAVCAADAALRRIAHEGPGRYDVDRAAQFRLTALDAARLSAHGVGRAGRVLEFADGRAQLPGESVSRIHLVELGFALPRLQVPVPAEDGGDYWVDFGLDDVFAFGEFDGKGKYRDLLLRHGLTMQQVLEKEKQREDWIRGTTQRRFGRWGSEHNTSAFALGDRLASFGIVPPRVPRRR